MSDRPGLDKILEQFTKTDGPIHNGPFDCRETDLAMSMPHPKNHVIELMAEAICAASHSREYWLSLNEADKSVWRNHARAALSVVEPAINWSHFVNMPEIDGDDVVY